MATFLPSNVPFGIAHRGGDEAAPENTLAAFEHAIGLGYRHLETDVHLTADGVLVAFHDGDLRRSAGRADAIADLTWSELSAVDLGGGHRVSRMAELFEALPDACFNIEPKSDGAVAPLAAAIRAADAVDRVGVGSFRDDRVRAVRSLLGVPLATSPGPRDLVRLGLHSWLGVYRFRPSLLPGHSSVQIPPRVGPVPLTRVQVDRFHRVGLQVHVWTINERSEMERLLDLGVDAIMSDKVSVLAEVLADRGLRPDGRYLD